MNAHGSLRGNVLGTVLSYKREPYVHREWSLGSPNIDRSSYAYILNPKPSKKLSPSPPETPNQYHTYLLGTRRVVPKNVGPILVPPNIRCRNRINNRKRPRLLRTTPGNCHDQLATPGLDFRSSGIGLKDSRVRGFRGLAFKGLGFEGLGFRGLEFRV